jgi:LacI family transcriptional regulator
MDKSSSPKLEDVARLAGVSTATVSRCFNTPDKVVETTRQKVMRIVDELGYTRHFGGRALASNRSNTVGAVIPTMENAIFARGLQAFQETLAKAGVTMLVASSGYDPEQEFQQIRTLVSQGADGLLLIGSARPAETYHFLRQRNIPHVLTWNNRAEPHCHTVGFDNRKAASRMAQRVIEFGHRNICIISANTENNDRAFDRIEGVREAMKRSGLSETDLTIISTSYSLANGGKALQNLMAISPRPTAVICGNDVLAAGALTKAKQMGLRIPQDISITGFDDIDLAEVVEPQLTTVHVPHRRMGEAAALLLLDILGGKDNCHNVELDTELILRDSLGVAKRPGAA